VGSASAIGLHEPMRERMSKGSAIGHTLARAASYACAGTTPAMHGSKRATQANQAAINLHIHFDDTALNRMRRRIFSLRR